MEGREGLACLCNDVQFSSVFVKLSQTNYQSRTEGQLRALSSTIHLVAGGGVVVWWCGGGGRYFISQSAKLAQHHHLLTSFCFTVQSEQMSGWCLVNETKGCGAQGMSSLVILSSQQIFNAIIGNNWSFIIHTFQLFLDPN